jgi:RND family efflux transporter MFP subunit
LYGVFANMKYFLWLALTVIGLMSASVGYFYVARNVDPIELLTSRELEVQVVRARRCTEPVPLHARGKISARQESDVISRLPGKVVELRFNVGDIVRAGEVVAVIRSDTLTRRISDSESALLKARSELATTMEELAQTEKELAHAREWHQQDLIARRDVEQAAASAETARTQADLARARVAQQEAMLAQARALERFARVTAPVAGIVQRRWVERGASVNDSSPLLTLAQGGLRAVVSVPADDSAELRPGMTVEIVNPTTPDKIFAGEIDSLDQQIKEGYRSVEIAIPLGDGPALAPDVVVDATIINGKHSTVIWVPRSAVVTSNNRNYVFKVIAGRATREEVSVADSRSEEVRITRGIEDGDLLIVDNISGLNSGRRVRPVAKR